MQYGPVFNDTFLSAVFALQEQIEQVKLTATNITLVVQLAYFLIFHSTTLSPGQSVCRQMTKKINNNNNNNNNTKIQNSLTEYNDPTNALLYNKTLI
jgi:hypothetical protein